MLNVKLILLKVVKINNLLNYYFILYTKIKITIQKRIFYEILKYQ